MKKIHIYYLLCFTIGVISGWIYSSQAAMPDEVNRVILKYEGTTYTNDPRDAGGPTKYGWTLRTYKQIYPDATVDDIKNLTEQRALDLYEIHFWDRYGARYITDNELAATVLLAQINLGYKRPNILLQQMTNAFCDSNLQIDGLLGHDSIHAVNRCKSTQIGYPYVIFYDKYLGFKSMSWAKKGLRARVMHYTTNDRSN